MNVEVRSVKWRIYKFSVEEFKAALGLPADAKVTAVEHRVRKETGKETETFEVYTKHTESE